MLNHSNVTVMPDSYFPIASHIAGVVLMSIVNGLGLVLNGVVLSVVIRLIHTRGHMSYWFVLNLCILDGLAALVVLPVAIASFVRESWLFDHVWCQASGFFCAFFMIASIASVCLISVERYYSIKHPMHYSAHMTLARTLVIFLVTWGLAAILAVLPLTGWNDYSYHHSRAHCTYSWTDREGHQGYVVLVGILCFLLPVLVMSVMYIGIYKVARQTAKQIGPAPSSSNPADPTDNKNNPTDLAPVVPPGRKYRGHFKAIKTLVIITGVFFVLWGPYFCLQLFGAIKGFIPAAPTLEILATWLGFTSIAINPCVYGIFNRSIREELVNLPNLFLSFCRSEANAETGPREDEDFWQFLDRTSTLPQHNGPLTLNVQPQVPVPFREVAEENMETRNL